MCRVWIFIWLSLHVPFSCEDIGRMLKIPGTRTADAICGDLRPRRCPFFTFSLLFQNLATLQHSFALNKRNLWRAV